MKFRPPYWYGRGENRPRPASRGLRDHIDQSMRKPSTPLQPHSIHLIDFRPDPRILQLRSGCFLEKRCR